MTPFFTWFLTSLNCFLMFTNLIFSRFVAFEFLVLFPSFKSSSIRCLLRKLWSLIEVKWQLSGVCLWLTTHYHGRSSRCTKMAVIPNMRLHNSTPSTNKWRHGGSIHNLLCGLYLAWQYVSYTHKHCDRRHLWWCSSDLWSSSRLNPGTCLFPL